MENKQKKNNHLKIHNLTDSVRKDKITGDAWDTDL